MEKNIMINTMLKAVLCTMINCMNERNNRALRGWSTDHVNVKIGALRECIEMAGYRMHILTEQVEITGGTYRGHLTDCYTVISFDVPGASAEDIKAFQEAGFEWLWINNVMRYVFAMNRKEKKTV